MAVREFTDSKGVEWRAWEITPDAIYPPTRAEDYLAECYRSGWVVFETKAGDRRVRVCPTPSDWNRLSTPELETLLSAGDALPARASHGNHAPVPELPRAPEPAAGVVTAIVAGGRPPRASLADLSVVRSFRYPGGRVWTVSVITADAEGGRRVLRFAAGGRALDLAEYPSAWADLSDDGLVDLLRKGAPRGGGAAAAGTPRRRWDDPRLDQP